MTGYEGDLTPAQAWALLAEDADAVLVDVRTHAEWVYVGVPDLSGIGRRTVFVEWQSYPGGAANEGFTEQLRQAGVGPGTAAVFLCRSGVRSVAAAQAATAAGIGPAYNVLEGFEGPTDEDGHRGAHGWRSEGLPWRQP